MWENLGRVMAETMQIDRIHRRSRRASRSCSQNIHRRYKDKLGPAIGVSLHMGNWELAIWPFTLAGNNPAAVYRTVKNPYVDRVSAQPAQDLYPGGLLGKGRDSARKGRRPRAASWVSCAMADGSGSCATCTTARALPVPFFGKPARSVTIPAMIARRLGARIWMSRCLRVGKQSRFKIELKELKVPRSANQADDVKWITAPCSASSRPGSARRPSSGCGAIGAGVSAGRFGLNPFRSGATLP